MALLSIISIRFFSFVRLIRCLCNVPVQLIKTKSSTQQTKKRKIDRRQVGHHILWTQYENLYCFKFIAHTNKKSVKMEDLLINFICRRLFFYVFRMPAIFHVVIIRLDALLCYPKQKLRI